MLFPTHKRTGAGNLREKTKQKWKALTIQKKIAVFTGVVCITILLSVVFNFWVVRFSLVDFNDILQDNAKCSELIQTLEDESILFESYMRRPDDAGRKKLDIAMRKTSVLYMTCRSGIRRLERCAIQKRGQSAIPMRYIVRKGMRCSRWKTT